MKNEKETVVNILTHIMELSKVKIEETQMNIFKFNLNNNLLDKNTSHIKSNSKITLTIACNIPEPIKLSFIQAGIDENKFRSTLPRILIINYEENLVNFQIGTNGPICELYHNKGPNSPWEQSKHFRTISKLAHQKYPIKPDISKTVFHYLVFKRRYQPWDNRKFKLDKHPVTITGDKAIIPDYWDYYEIPEIILQNQDIIPDYIWWRKWIRKNGTYCETDVSYFDTINEYLHQLNGYAPSKLFKKHDSYVNDPSYWIDIFKNIRQTPNNNLYWQNYFY